MPTYTFKPGRSKLPNGNTQIIFHEILLTVERVPVANGFVLLHALSVPTLNLEWLPPPDQQPPKRLLGGGAAFFILDSQGRVWDGLDWTADREEAYLYSAPPDPYARCQDAVVRLRRSGCDCGIAYALPGNKRAASQVPSAKLPDADPLR